MNRCNFGRFDSKTCRCAHNSSKKDVEVQLHIFLSMELDESDWPASGSSYIIPRESISIFTEYRMTGAYSQAKYFKDQKNLFYYICKHAQTRQCYNLVH
jgi:hypothetical protein